MEACAKRGVRVRYGASTEGLRRVEPPAAGSAAAGGAAGRDRGAEASPAPPRQGDQPQAAKAARAGAGGGVRTRWACALSDGTEVSGDRVILATGGLSFPAVGTDGTGHRIAREQLGHSLNEPYPALVPLTGPHPVRFVRRALCPPRPGSESGHPGGLCVGGQSQLWSCLREPARAPSPSPTPPARRAARTSRACRFRRFISGATRGRAGARRRAARPSVPTCRACAPSRPEPSAARAGHDEGRARGLSLHAPRVLRAGGAGPVSHEVWSVRERPPRRTPPARLRGCGWAGPGPWFERSPPTPSFPGARAPAASWRRSAGRRRRRLSLPTGPGRGGRRGRSGWPGPGGSSWCAAAASGPPRGERRRRRGAARPGGGSPSVRRRPRSQAPPGAPSTAAPRRPLTFPRRTPQASVVSRHVPARLAEALCAEAGIPEGRRQAELRRDERIKCAPVTFSRPRSFLSFFSFPLLSSSSFRLCSACAPPRRPTARPLGRRKAPRRSA